MSDIVVAPDTFRKYGEVANEMAARTASVGAVDQAAIIAAALPVFGLIGQDFLAAFAGAQANHFAGVAQLAEVHAATAATAHAGANAYQAAEHASSNGFLAL
jgi:hypothetical protein